MHDSNTQLKSCFERYVGAFVVQLEEIKGRLDHLEHPGGIISTKEKSTQTEKVEILQQKMEGIELISSKL